MANGQPPPSQSLWLSAWRCFSFRFLSPVVQDGSPAPLGMPCFAYGGGGRAELINLSLPSPHRTLVGIL